MSFPGFARLALTSLVLIASMSPLVAADATAQTSEVAQSATQSAILADPEAASETQSSGRLFAQTGFAVSDDQIWNYFNAHGGAAVLGDPLSRQFTLQGSTVQLFERGALQVAPGQGVRALNLIDLLPYSPVDGYQLPSVDDALVAAAPSRDASDFTARALEFVQSNVKDASGETQTGFLTLYEAAAPGRDAVAGVTMGLDLWGLPTTAAVADPDQSNVLYQRFERGFMVRDTDANTTNVLPLGRYLKRVIWGEPDPSDLAAQAQDSTLWNQYSPTEPTWIARPTDLPATDMTQAFVFEAPNGNGVEVKGISSGAAGSGPQYGMNIFIWDQPSTTQRDLQKVTGAGFGWQKSLFQWRLIEPQRGVYNWTEAERVVKASNAAGVKVIARLDFEPTWARADHAANGPPDNYQDYASFVNAVVDHFKPGSPNGTIAAIELWNEPNLSREWGNQPISRASAADYVRLMCLANTAAKRASPAIVTISAGLSPTGVINSEAVDDTVFLQWMYDAAPQGCFDVLGAHGAGYKAPPSISPQELSSNTEWGGHSSFGFRRVEMLRDVMVRNNDAAKQVWLLEFGWTSDSLHQAYAWHRVTEQQKAQYIVDAFRFARDNWQPWIGVMTVWNVAAPDWSPEREEYWWSITNPDGSTRPAYDALVQARRNGTLP